MPNNRTNPLHQFYKAAWLTCVLLLTFSSHAQTSEYSVNILKDNQYGHYLSTRENMTLYISQANNDKQNQCNKQCQKRWAPYTLAANETLSSPPELSRDLSVINSNDGTRQIAYRGNVLYRWIKDQTPMEHLGHKRGKKGRKYLIANISPPISTLTTDGKTWLVGPGGMTLYAMGKNRESMRDCQRGCADNWPPLVTGSRQLMVSILVEGKIGTIKRLAPDNRLQVTYQGRPLHYWSRDTVPGDATGHGIGGIWHTVNP